MSLFPHPLQTLHIFILGQTLVIKTSVTPSPGDICRGQDPANAAADCISTLLSGGMRAHSRPERSDGVEASSVIQDKSSRKEIEENELH